MALSKYHLIGTGLAAATVACAGTLAYTAIAARAKLPPVPDRAALAYAGDSHPAEARRDQAVAQRGKDAPPASAPPASKDAAPPAKTPSAPAAPPARKDSAAPDKPAAAAPAPEARTGTGRDVRVRAPHTEVDVDKERGKVRVRAPYTSVNVDPDRGQVRVRAPYVNLDIRW
jgi:hypothetical protein